MRLSLDEDYAGEIKSIIRTIYLPKNNCHYYLK